MCNIQSWMEQLAEELKNEFGSRLWFLGLQGSFGRGEGTAESDIDAVVILDRWNRRFAAVQWAAGPAARTGKRPAVLCAGGRSSKTGIPPICYLSVWTPCR